MNASRPFASKRAVTKDATSSTWSRRRLEPCCTFDHFCDAMAWALHKVASPFMRTTALGLTTSSMSRDRRDPLVAGWSLAKRPLMEFRSAAAGPSLSVDSASDSLDSSTRAWRRLRSRPTSTPACPAFCRARSFCSKSASWPASQVSKICSKSCSAVLASSVCSQASCRDQTSKPRAADHTSALKKVASVNDDVGAASNARCCASNRSSLDCVRAPPRLMVCECFANVLVAVSTLPSFCVRKALSERCVSSSDSGSCSCHSKYVRMMLCLELWSLATEATCHRLLLNSATTRRWFRRSSAAWPSSTTGSSSRSMDDASGRSMPCGKHVETTTRTFGGKTWGSQLKFTSPASFRKRFSPSMTSKTSPFAPACSSNPGSFQARLLAEKSRGSARSNLATNSQTRRFSSSLTRSDCLVHPTTCTNWNSGVNEGCCLRSRFSAARRLASHAATIVDLLLPGGPRTTRGFMTKLCPGLVWSSQARSIC